MNRDMSERNNSGQGQKYRLNNKSVVLALGLLITGVLSSCNEEQATSVDVDADRWYSDSQQARGAEVFASNCAQCHGSEAQGLVADWRQKQEDGSFPPPPLNGSAHAWHHPQSVLMQVIDNGGTAFGGKMPEFATVLEQADKLSAIAYFQSFWSDEIYQQWEDMGGNN